MQVLLQGAEEPVTLTAQQAARLKALDQEALQEEGPTPLPLGVKDWAAYEAARDGQEGMRARKVVCGLAVACFVGDAETEGRLMREVEAHSSQGLKEFVNWLSKGASPPPLSELYDIVLENPQAFGAAAEVPPLQEPAEDGLLARAAPEPPEGWQATHLAPGWVPLAATLEEVFGQNTARLLDSMGSAQAALDSPYGREEMGRASRARAVACMAQTCGALIRDAERNLTLAEHAEAAATKTDREAANLTRKAQHEADEQRRQRLLTLADARMKTKREHLAAVETLKGRAAETRVRLASMQWWSTLVACAAAPRYAQELRSLASPHMVRIALLLKALDAALGHLQLPPHVESRLVKRLSAGMVAHQTRPSTMCCASCRYSALRVAVLDERNRVQVVDGQSVVWQRGINANTSIINNTLFAALMDRLLCVRDPLDRPLRVVSACGYHAGGHRGLMPGEEGAAFATYVIGPPLAGAAAHHIDFKSLYSQSSRKRSRAEAEEDQQEAAAEEVEED